MKRIFTTLLVLVSVISAQHVGAQVALSTDCSSQYLVRACQEANDKHNDYVSFTYDENRRLSSMTQGEGSKSITMDVIWTSTNIVYKYAGYDLVTAILDEKGNAKSMTNLDGESITYNYEDGYLVSFTANTRYGAESGQIKWKDGNPVEVKHTTSDLVITYTFEYSDTPNNTNLDFGILQCSTVVSFALPLGKGIKNLPKHTEEYYGSAVSEIAELTYEFDSLDRPIKLISKGTDYEDNKNKDFTNIVLVSYDESFTPLSIAKPFVESQDDSQTYNIMGQKVNGVQKGVVIKGGKNYVIK